MAAPRNRLFALAAALLVGAACKRAPVEPPSPAAELAAPEPSSSLVASPLDSAATGYTNEMQAANLSRETSELGIQQISKHVEEGDPGPARTEAPPPLSEVEKKERLEQLKEMRIKFSMMRRGIDAERDKSVSLQGTTASIIAGRESGGVLGAVEDAPGVYSGAYGGAVETGERVVSDAAAWAELWGRVSRETPPVVDFAKTRVAAIFAGTRPSGGFRARLVGIATEPTRYVVRWLEEGPAPDEAAPEGETAPFLLVYVPQDERAVRIEKIRRGRKAQNK